VEAGDGSLWLVPNLRLHLRNTIPVVKENEVQGTPGIESRTHSLSRVLAHEDALARARTHFLSEGTLDMQNLAEELGVSRATLYRVVGNRDRLLGDVIWDLGARTLRRAIEETSPDVKGADRIIETSKRFNEYVVTFAPMRNFLQNEPLTAFRVLFSPVGRVHNRAVAAWRRMLEEASEQGELALPIDADKLAYVIVRTGESMLYADLIGGREPDIDLAASVQRAVLQARYQ
jgi:AcrR family transcriptional regulator